MCYLQSGPGTAAVVVLALIPVPQYPVCAETLHLASLPSACSLLLREAQEGLLDSVVDGTEEYGKQEVKEKMRMVRKQQFCPLSRQTQSFLRG